MARVDAPAPRRWAKPSQCKFSRRARSRFRGLISSGLAQHEAAALKPARGQQLQTHAPGFRFPSQLPCDWHFQRTSGSKTFAQLLEGSACGEKKIVGHVFVGFEHETGVDEELQHIAMGADLRLGEGRSEGGCEFRRLQADIAFHHGAGARASGIS
ncbi:MAG: hypothetical protein IPL62_21135 [Caulobacteraceae bacterium]|nr:hypothetical protein [Caulobacteraceae bacterium]